MSKKIIENVLIYTRVSTQEQVNGYSLDHQKNEIIDYCKKMGYNIVGTYTDEGITGTSIEKRPGFKQLLKHIESDSNVNAIIAWKLSRFSRNMIDLTRILDFLEHSNVALISITDNINTFAPINKMFCYMAGIFAEMERDNIISQTKGGMKERAKKGKWNGGITPIGYDYSNDKLIINEEEAETVKTIFNLYTNENWGYSKICQFLNRNLDKYATKKGSTWAYATIKQVLDNPIFAGYIRWGVREDWAKKRRKGINKEVPLEKGLHKAIIDEDLWERTQAKRKLVGKTPTKLSNYTYMLSGLPRCPECGSAMVSQRSTRTNKKSGEKVTYRYYACSKWNSHKGDVCHPNAVRAEELEKQVSDKIIEFINSSDIARILEKEMKKESNTKEIENTIKDLEKQISKLQRRKDNYTIMRGDGELSKEEYLEKKGEVEDALLPLIEELNLTKQKLQTIKENQYTQEKLTVLLKNFDKLFKNATDEQKKVLMHKTIKEIKINPSDDINERRATEITLRLKENMLNEDSSKENLLLLTCDTVHL
ncbi:recombinase family protein [Clostridium sp. 19966]|uniref:recombinase family protein n=1 Tax=Clostridium sp. 19966 TaxID=2768166 RepID=UPI0028DF5ECE|nr:recombinase family protein [Clostridium sp. 19966]MDT8719524.1 recombinase family protein [Clostridium sp. 19966]